MAAGDPLLLEGVLVRRQRRLCVNRGTPSGYARIAAPFMSAAMR